MIARTLSAMIGLVLLSGCIDVTPGGGPAAKLYGLSPKNTFTFTDIQPTVDWQLVVELPLSSETLNTQRIALSHEPLTLDYYGGARWAERAPVMVQTLLVESFENTGKIVAVARKSLDLRADYVLKTDLREFQAEYGDGDLPLIRVKINSKLVKMPQRIIIASFQSERTVQSEGTNMLAIVQAYDKALGKVIKSIVQWALAAPNRR